jgi:hypothetical protein
MASASNTVEEYVGPTGTTLDFGGTANLDLFPPKLRKTGESLHKWRARIVTNNPLLPCTRWFSLPGNNVTEAKLRKPELRAN